MNVFIFSNVKNLSNKRGQNQNKTKEHSFFCRAEVPYLKVRLSEDKTKKPPTQCTHTAPFLTQSLRKLLKKWHLKVRRIDFFFIFAPRILL